MTSDSEKVLSCLGLLAGLVGVIIVASILNGWAISVLWLWFVAPLFGLPVLTIPQAIGLSLVIGMFTSRYRDQDDAKDKTGRIVNSLVLAVFMPVFAVVIGSVVKMFI